MRINNLLIMLIIGALFVSIAGVSAHDDAGSLTELKNYIVASDNKVVLNKDYQFKPGDDKYGFILNTSGDVVIDGRGHTIDFKDKARLVHIKEAKSVLIKNVKFYRGQGCEAGVLACDAPLTIKNCRFESCSAACCGAAIKCKNGITLESCNFTDNYAGARVSYALGGAISCDGDAKITNCKFINNKIDKMSLGTSKGGAIYCTGKVLVQNSKFDFNKAERGGAIWAWKKVNLYDSVFQYNEAKHGGAVYSNSGNVFANNNDFSGNFADYGGVIYCDDVGTTVYLNGNDFIKNKAKQGSVVYNYGEFGLIINNYYGPLHIDWDSGIFYEHKYLHHDIMHKDQCVSDKPHY